MTRGQNRCVLAGMALGRTDVADGAVAMLDVATLNECAGPSSGFIEPGKAFGWEFRAILGRAKQTLGVVLQKYLTSRRSTLPLPVMALLSSELMTSPPR